MTQRATLINPATAEDAVWSCAHHADDGRRIVHGIVHGIRSDWTAASVIAMIRSADTRHGIRQVAWSRSPYGTCLLVVHGGKRYLFTTVHPDG